MYTESDRQYYNNHRDEILRKRKERHIKNRERDSLLSKKYYEEHREAMNEYRAKYAREHRKHANEHHHAQQVSWKKRFLNAYGNRCSCCGESNSAFLTVDHVQGQAGKKYKESSTRAYKRAIEERESGLYRILCMNCNMAVRFGRTCPHQIKEQGE